MDPYIFFMRSTSSDNLFSMKLSWDFNDNSSRTFFLILVDFSPSRSMKLITGYSATIIFKIPLVIEIFISSKKLVLYKFFNT